MPVSIKNVISDLARQFKNSLRVHEELTVMTSAKHGSGMDDLFHSIRSVVREVDGMCLLCVYT